MSQQLQVTLVGNYAADGQPSMQRFTTLLHDGLVARGIPATLVRPAPLFGHRLARPHGVGKWIGYADKFLTFPPRLRWAVRSKTTPPTVVHICDHSSAMYVPRMPSVPHVVTCHDLLAVRAARGAFAETRTGRSGRVLQAWIASGLRRATAIVCDSNATRADVQRIIGAEDERVGVIYPGLSPTLLRPDAVASPRVREWADGTRPYILHVGGNQWYKNRPGAVAIYAALVARMPDAPPLVLAGKPFAGNVTAAIDRHRLASRIVEIAKPTDGELAALYPAASLLLFPSWAEGFGWPVLEAMACGCRVVASNRAPLTEVGGDAVAYVDPRDPIGAASVVADVLSESGRQRRTRVNAGLAQAARFGCDRMIDAYVAVYEGVIGRAPVSGESPVHARSTLAQ